MMNSIKKNYLYSSIYQILNMILPLITAPYVARVLGAQVVGKYTYTYSIANYFVIFAMLGISNYGNRSCAKIRDDKSKLSQTFWSIYSMQFFISLFLTLLYFVYFFFIHTQDIIFQLQLFFVISAMFDISWFFYGVEDFKLIVSKNIVIRILSAILIFSFVKSPQDLWIYTFVLSFGVLFGFLVTFFQIKKYIDFYRPSKMEILSHVKPNLILFIPVVAVSLYKIMDKVMLGGFSELTQLGYYEYAEKLTFLPLGLINSFGAVMLPRMSNLVEKKDKTVENKLLEKSMVFVIFLSSAMAFGLVAIGDKLLPLLFGSEYSLSVPILYCLIPSMLFVSWANIIRTQYLIPRGMDKEYIVSVIVGAMINLIINYLFIPQYGGLGAAIGTVVAEFSVCLCQSLMVWKKMNLYHYLKKVFPFLLFGIIMCVMVYVIGIFIPHAILSLFLQILIGAMIYCAMSYYYLRRKLKWSL